MAVGAVVGHAGWLISAYDEFDGVSKGGIAQATQGLTQLRRQFFGSETQQSS